MYEDLTTSHFKKEKKNGSNLYIPDLFYFILEV